MQTAFYALAMELEKLLVNNKITANNVSKTL